jgi:hypothetical protein
MYTYTTRCADVDIVQKAGDTMNMVFQIRFEDQTVNFGDYTSALMQIRSYEGADVSLQFSSTGATHFINIDELASGQFAIEGDIDLETGHYYYDLQLSNVDVTETIMSGKFIVEPDYSY